MRILRSKKFWLVIGGMVIVSLSLAFLPFLIGGFAGYKLYKGNLSSKKKWTFICIAVFLSMIIGVPWTYAFFKSDTTKTASVTKTEISPSVDPNIQNEVSETETNASTNAPTPVSQNEHSPQDTQKAKVVHVVDGDTIDFSIDGKTERVRVIGINTPETVDPRKSVECFGQEASRIAKLTLEVGTEVELEKDPTQGNRDKYNRLLRYVWTDDGIVDFGKVMISLGYAYEYTYNTPYKYQTLYKNAQKEAETGRKGLWADGACAVTPKPTTSANSSTNTATNTAYSGKYSCTGPDLDCSDFKTHAEAQSFFNSCGFSASNDPMRLDRATGTGNGLACESLP